MNDLLRKFFGREYENSISNKMMFYDYEFPYDEVERYIHQLLEIELPDFIKFVIDSDEQIEITAKDVCQFSNFDDCTINLCRKLLERNNPGVSCVEAGRILLDDGKERTKLAFTKYGENHAKTGEMLGMIYCLGSTYYVSSLGMVFVNMSEQERQKLLSRLVIRTNLCRRVLKATQNGPVNMRQFLFMISDSTYKRRKSNIKIILPLALGNSYSNTILL